MAKTLSVHAMSAVELARRMAASGAAVNKGFGPEYIVGIHRLCPEGQMLVVHVAHRIFVIDEASQETLVGREIKFLRIEKETIRLRNIGITNHWYFPKTDEEIKFSNEN